MDNSTQADASTLTMDSVIQFRWGPPGTKFNTHETWKLSEGGQVLTIQRKSDSPRGPMNLTLVFEKR